MEQLYEDLRRGDRPPAAALREAQLDMVRGGLRRGTGGLDRDRVDAEDGGRVPPFYQAAFALSTDRP